jgi:hypothetical protein
VPDDEDIEHFFRPLALSAEVTIAAKHMLKLKALAITVGAIDSARGAVGSMGWIVLDPAPEIELINVAIHSGSKRVNVKTPKVFVSPEHVNLQRTLRDQRVQNAQQAATIASLTSVLNDSSFEAREDNPEIADAFAKYTRSASVRERATADAAAAAKRKLAKRRSRLMEANDIMRSALAAPPVSMSKETVSLTQSNAGSKTPMLVSPAPVVNEVDAQVESRKEQIARKQPSAKRPEGVDGGGGDDAPPPSAPRTAEQDAILHARLVVFFTDVAPSKVPSIPALMLKYTGKETSMLRALSKKYGKVIPSSPPLPTPIAAYAEGGSGVVDSTELRVANLEDAKDLLRGMW